MLIDRLDSRPEHAAWELEDRYREQQGYRGRYNVVQEVAEVVLALDDTVCPHVFEGGLALARAPSVTLRCLLAMPRATIPISAPVMLCQPIDGQPAELATHQVE